MHSEDSRQTKLKQGVRGSRLGELEKQVSAAHFKSSSLIREEPENSETKKVALQRSYHFVSWSGNSRRSQAGSLLPIDERFPTFFFPLISRWQDHSTFLFVDVVVEPPRHSAILSVTEALCDAPLPPHLHSQSTSLRVATAGIRFCELPLVKQKAACVF